MLSSKLLFNLVFLVTFSIAIPSPIEKAPRSTCSLSPTYLAPIYENNPNYVSESLPIFYVSQGWNDNTGEYEDRTYMLAQFNFPVGSAISNANNVQLVLTIPSSYSEISNEPSSPPPFIFVNDLYVDLQGFDTPNTENWNWYYIVTSGYDINEGYRNSVPYGIPAIGGFSLVAGQTSSIEVDMSNFDYSDVIAFQFRIWLPWQQNADAWIIFGGGAGLFVTYDC